MHPTIQSALEKDLAICDLINSIEAPSIEELRKLKKLAGLFLVNFWYLPGYLELGGGKPFWSFLVLKSVRE